MARPVYDFLLPVVTLLFSFIPMWVRKFVTDCDSCSEVTVWELKFWALSIVPHRLLCFPFPWSISMRLSQIKKSWQKALGRAEWVHEVVSSWLYFCDWFQSCRFCFSFFSFARFLKIKKALTCGNPSHACDTNKFSGQQMFSRPGEITKYFHRHP